LPSLADICRICDEWGDVTLSTLTLATPLNRREVLHCKC
jgi:hypothetical protein